MNMQEKSKPKVYRNLQSAIIQSHDTVRIRQQRSYQQGDCREETRCDPRSNISLDFSHSGQVPLQTVTLFFQWQGWS